MIAPEKDLEIPKRLKRKASKDRHPFEIRNQFQRDQDFIDLSPKSIKHQEKEASVFSSILDHIFIGSLAWTKICAVALLTEVSLVRIVNFSQMQAFLILACIYGITWFNYHLIFLALKRPTLGQSLQ